MDMNDYKNVTDRLQIRERCREEVFTMKNRTGKIKHKMNKKAVALIAAAALTVGAGTAAVAADKLGAFDRLSERQNNTVILDDGREIPDPIMKYDNDNYQNIAEHADPVDETFSLESDDNGLSINVESVYCDGMNLIIGITGSLTDGNPQAYDYIGLGTELTINGRTYSTELDDRSRIRFDSNLILNEGTENEFSGSIKLMLQPSDRITEPATADIKIYNTVGIENWYDNAPVDESLGTPLEISVDVVPKIELISEAGLEFSDGGFEAKIYEITPDCFTIGTGYPKGYGNVETACYDDNDNKIPFIPMYSQPDYGDGLHTFICAATDTSTITVKWFSKQDCSQIYEYTFTLPE